MEYFTLQTGVQIPAIGYGTVKLGKPPTEANLDYSALQTAINVGYRFFDTAMLYRNEDGIGKVLSECGVPRGELFISNKFPNNPPYHNTVESIRQAVEKSLQRMQTDYYDLYLIHYAIPNKVKSLEGAAGVNTLTMDIEKACQLWITMNDLKKEGKVQAVGVSYFDNNQLDVLIENTGIVPMVNQIRCNPAVPNFELIEYCKKMNILPEAHSPLNFAAGPGDIRKDPAYVERICQVGKKYGKTWSQVLLRSYFQNGVVSVPGSTSRSHQAENLDIFDFALTSEDMAIVQNR